MAVPNAKPLTWGLRVSPEEIENLCKEYLPKTMGFLSTSC
jgi:hypothetical protein